MCDTYTTRLTFIYWVNVIAQAGQFFHLMYENRVNCYTRTSRIIHWNKNCLCSSTYSTKACIEYKGHTFLTHCTWLIFCALRLFHENDDVDGYHFLKYHLTIKCDVPLRFSSFNSVYFLTSFGCNHGAQQFFFLRILHLSTCSQL